jgi:hypothetical protein
LAYNGKIVVLSPFLGYFRGVIKAILSFLTFRRAIIKLEIEYNNVIRIEKGGTNFTIGALVKSANALKASLNVII